MQKHKNNTIKTTICNMIFTILSLHLINKAVFFIASLQSRSDKPNGTYFQWRYGNVYYEKRGTGTPLLLIHDLNTSSSAYEWNNVVQPLSEKYTVYTIDLIGCGRSDKPKLTYTNYLYVQLLRDFISQIIKQKTNVVATGLSGSFVIMACYANPDLFDKLVFVNPCDLAALNQAPNRCSRTIKFLIETPVIGTFLYNICMSKAAHLNSSDARYLFASLKGNFVNISPMHILHKITTPVLLITGNKRPDSSSILDAYCRQNVAFSKCVIANTKMLPQLENPDAFLSKIINFYS